MQRAASLQREERVRRLLNPVVDELHHAWESVETLVQVPGSPRRLVRLAQWNEQSVLQSRPELGRRRRARAPAHLCQRPQVEAMSDAGARLQEGLCRVGKATDGLRHELQNIVRYRHLPERRQVPFPTTLSRLEVEPFLGMERMQ